MLNELSQSMSHRNRPNNNEKLMTMRALIIKNLERIKSKGGKSKINEINLFLMEYN